MDEQLLHAIDLIAVGEIERSKILLENVESPIATRLSSLLREQQGRDRERTQALSIIRHELGNALSIAQANVEGMIDGVLPFTPERLAGIRDALAMCGRLIDDLKRAPRLSGDAAPAAQRFNICELIGAQVSMLSAIAESKNVHMSYDPCQNDGSENFSGDPQRIAHLLRNVLLNAVRYTPPGGSVSVSCCRHESELTVRVTDGIGLSSVSNLLTSLGGEARILAQSPEETTFGIKLPVLAA